MSSVTDFLPQVINLICPNCDPNSAIALVLLFFFEGFFAMEYFVSRISNKQYKLIYQKTPFIVKCVFLTFIAATSFYFWFLLYQSLSLLGFNIILPGYEMLILQMLGFVTMFAIIVASYRVTYAKRKPSVLHPTMFWSTILFFIAVGLFSSISIAKIHQKNPMFFILLSVTFIAFLIFGPSLLNRIFNNSKKK